MAQNQNNLSGMADSKANILISVNSIILSIILSTMFVQIEKTPNLLFPVIIMVSVCVAIVFAILATRPNVSHGTFTQDDIKNKKTNLLFWKLSWNGFTGLLMGNGRNAGRPRLFIQQCGKRQLFLGLVLAKKYRYLRIAYNIFMWGLIVSILAFAVIFVLPALTVQETYSDLPF
jgi:hypothetical protein